MMPRTLSVPLVLAALGLARVAGEDPNGTTPETGCVRYWTQGTCGGGDEPPSRCECEEPLPNNCTVSSYRSNSATFTYAIGCQQGQSCTTVIVHRNVRCYVLNSCYNSFGPPYRWCIPEVWSCQFWAESIWATDYELTEEYCSHSWSPA